MTPYFVRTDVIEAYENRTGFIGLGEFLQRKGAIVMNMNEKPVVRCEKIERD
ncbi:hypothetical protein ACKUB1_09765 [Methanospirillum stamsii]|nr:hypothetical protein [Methanospirillum stamsii]